jgi:flagellar export protein FliJ
MIGAELGEAAEKGRPARAGRFGRVAGTDGRAAHGAGASPPRAFRRGRQHAEAGLAFAGFPPSNGRCRRASGGKVMTPRTRLDKVVQIRERAADDALAGLARARTAADSARDRLAHAVRATRHDARAAGPVELWQLDELAHRRALQAVRSAEGEVRQAAQGEVSARDGYAAAHQKKEIVSRVQERRRAELVLELEKRERRDADEIAMLRFNASR